MRQGAKLATYAEIAASQPKRSNFERKRHPIKPGPNRQGTSFQTGSLIGKHSVNMGIFNCGPNRIFYQGSVGNNYN